MKALIVCLLLSFSLPCFSAGDAKSGQSKALVCGACHGAEGQSTNPQWPNLAGQHAKYLVQQLQAYQTGTTRTSPIMAPLVAALTQEDMEDLSAWYAQKPLVTPGTKASSAHGEQLYRQGDMEKQIPACVACHGPNGRGAEQAGFPMISHQQPEYLIQQLQAFKAGTRSTDPLKIMRTICAKLSAEDMQDLAQYIGHLD